uniref:Fas apoptotic inhibitory molecule 1 n=1 Tax=Syphacia muris TaxID=451379 RepID=A0A0N5AI13_9BILA
MSANSEDLVARWTIPLHNKIHEVEFEHGTTTGKRVVRVDGKEVIRKEWMFKLVGRETFSIGDIKCSINAEAQGPFSYMYTLEVLGKSYDKFIEDQERQLKVWYLNVKGQQHRVCLDKKAMDIWVDGSKVDTAGEFVDGGTETHFEIDNVACCIKTSSSGRRSTGVIYKLFLDDKEIQPVQSS